MVGHDLISFLLLFRQMETDNALQIVGDGQLRGSCATGYKAVSNLLEG